MANEEQLSILKRGVEVWNKWREENCGTVIELGSVNLTGVSLANGDLTSANLTGADLSAADLTGANLSGAKGWWTTSSTASRSQARSSSRVHQEVENPR